MTILHLEDELQNGSFMTSSKDCVLKKRPPITKIRAAVPRIANQIDGFFFICTHSFPISGIIAKGAEKF